MKIADLAPILVTRMEVLDGKDQPTGVFFTGHTPISREFIEANRKHFPLSRSQSLYITKNGEQRVDVKVDPNSEAKRIAVLADVTTNVEGIDDFDIATDSVHDLFNNPALAKAVVQWREHLDDEGKHSPPPAESAKRTSKTSAG